MRGEDGPGLADDVLGTSVLVANSITNLHHRKSAPSNCFTRTPVRPPTKGERGTTQPLPQTPRQKTQAGKRRRRRRTRTRTYVNVDQHAIALVAANLGRHHDEGIGADKVADAALLLEALGAAVRSQLQLEGAGGTDEEQQGAEPLHERALRCHWVWELEMLEMSGESGESRLQGGEGREFGALRVACFLPSGSF